MVIYPRSTRKRVLTAAIAGLLLTASGPAAHAQAVVTEDIIVEAVRQHNLALQAARAAASAEAERPDQVRWPFPMVEAMAMPQMIAEGELGLSLMARQQIPWGDRLRADRAARAAMAEAAGFEAGSFEREQVLIGRSAYAELWGLQEQRTLVDSFRVQLAFYREIALDQFRTGRGPQQAVLNIELERQMLTQRLDALEEKATGQRAMIAALTGGSVRLRPTDRLARPETAAVEDPAMVSDLIETHPMVSPGQSMRDAEEAMGRMARTMLRPDFTVGATVNLSPAARQRMFGQEVFTPSLGVMLPLWRGGIRAEIREFEERARQRELETEHTRIMLGAEAADALSQIERVRARIARYERELLPTIEQTLDASLLGYQTGVVRFLELLDAQRMAFTIQVDVIEARVQEAQLQARLAAITGPLGRADARR
jgi:outer membrane protein, heavy metal efflux system